MSAETVVEAEVVCGRCEIVCGEEIEGDKDEWFSAASDRFYFFEVGGALPPPFHACDVNPETPSGLQQLLQGVLRPSPSRQGSLKEGQGTLHEGGVVPASSDLLCSPGQGQGQGEEGEGSA